MDILLIFETFRTLTGLPRDEAVGWYTLCDAACESLSKKVKPEALCEKNRVALCSAAAADAFLNYVLVCAATEGDTDFSAGDVSVKQSAAEKITAATQLKNSAFAEISPLLCDRNFYFAKTEEEQ